MHIVLVARREDRLQALARELDSLHGAKSVVIASDLTAPGAAAQLVAETSDQGIDVSLVVNNAGFGQVTSLEDHDLDRDLAMIDLNLRVLTELTYLYLKPMVAAGSGSVINIASVAAFQPVAYMPVYSAGKAYVLHFSEGLWAEVRGSGAHVMAVCPGTTETEFFDEAGVPGWLQKQSSQTPERVVRLALRGLDRRKPVVVTGLKNRVLTSLTRFFPRRLVVLETRKYFRPRNRT